MPAGSVPPVIAQQSRYHGGMSTHAHPVPPPLILASASPRRKTLLASLGITFDIVVSDEAEDVEPGRSPESHAVLLAERKARAVAKEFASGFVLGADTIVVLDGEILGMPAYDDGAARMLRQLCGRCIGLITGVSLIDAATGVSRNAIVTSTVHVRPLSEEAIAAYVATGEPRDKAGAYAIQGIGGKLIEQLEGCFNNVVGLPLCAVAPLLTDAGVAIPAGWDGCRLPDGSLCPRMV